VKQSVGESAENVIQKTTEDITTTVTKNTAETIASVTSGQTSKEIKEQLAQQALEKVDDKTAQFVHSITEKLGNDIVSIKKAVALVEKYGDSAIKALDAVDSNAVNKLLRSLDNDLLDDAIQQGSEAFAALSGWTEKELKEHGNDLVARATKDAEVLNDVKTLISKGPIDPKNLTNEQKELIEKIAANSTFNGNAQKVLVGKWVGLDGGFLQRAKEIGALHYSPHPDMWSLLGKLDNQNEVAWLVNEQVIQNGMSKGLKIEYTLNAVTHIDNEMDAIDAIFSGQTDEQIMQLLDSKYLPVRMKELQQLQKAGYECMFESASNSYVLMKP
jgi:hypothetical protein